MRSLWYILSGGKQPNLILWGEETEGEHWWPKLWGSEAGRGGAQRDRAVDADSEDPIQRARDIRDASVGMGDEEDPGEDYFDGMTRRRGGGNEDGNEDVYADLEDEWELLVVGFLLLSILGLVMLRRWYETRRQQELERQRRQQQQHNGQNLPPPPPPFPADRLAAPWG